MKNWRGIILLNVLLTVTIVAAPYFALAASLNDLINQKDQLNQELNKNQAAADNKAKEAQTLSTQISSLDSDIKNTEVRISDTNKKIDDANAVIGQLAGDISKKTQELQILKRKLNDSIVEIYRSASRSDWELLFSSNSLSDSVNQMKYTETIETQVKAVHSQVSDAKSVLEKQKSEQEAKKAELDQLKSQQEANRKSAEYQMSQKDKLLGMTVEQQKEYEIMVGKLQSEIAHISNAIYLERQKRAGGGWELGGGGSGYPISCSSGSDPWGFVPCQCTSYVAWYWNVVRGKHWINTRPGSGSAYNWPALAGDPQNGYSVSSTPRVGAIISWNRPMYPNDQWGHVAIVEGVNSDGTIDISEYNYLYSERFSRRLGVNPADEGVSYSYIY
jgi:surface antigen